MRTVMVTVFVVALLTGLLTGVVADEKVTVYSGSVTLASWGAGVVEVDDEETYLSNPALRIETKGFYEGARLDLGEPIEVDTFLGEPANGYVSLAVMVPEPEEAQQTGQPGGGAGDFGAFPAEPGGAPVDPGMAPGMEGMDPAMDPGMDMGMGEANMPGMGEIAQPEEPVKVRQVRVLLVTDKGELDSGPITVQDYVEIVEDWRSIVVPLSAFGASADLAGAKILSVAVFGDVEETFYLGELVLGQEDHPLLADAGEKVIVGADIEVTFKGAAQPAGTNANYLWDFDDLDGLQEQGYGQETAWTFLTPGFYIVTLQVSDPAGKKVTRTCRLRVEVRAEMPEEDE